MSDSAEKSCWGITLWAVTLVVAVVFVSSVLTGRNDSTVVSSDPSAVVTATIAAE